MIQRITLLGGQAYTVGGVTLELEGTGMHRQGGGQSTITATVRVTTPDDALLTDDDVGPSDAHDEADATP